MPDNIANHHPVNRKGLVGWWTYRNTGSVSVSGTWKDYSGNANNGTLNSNTLVNSSGAVLNGTNTACTIGASAKAWSQSNTWSVSFNFYLKGSIDSNAYRIIGDWQYSPSSRRSFSIMFYDGNLTLAWSLNGSNDNTATIASSGQISLNTWYRIDVVSNGTTIKSYLNTTEKTSNVLSSALYSSPDTFGIGSNWNATGDFINANIDDLQIYNRALSTNEIKRNYLKTLRG